VRRWEVIEGYITVVGMHQIHFQSNPNPILELGLTGIEFGFDRI